MAWAVATGVLFLFLVFLILRTHQLRVRWRTGIVRGQPVLFSDEWGPAVVGFSRPQVVLPGWCKDLDDGALRFILDHELEHVRAGDLRLMILAGMVPVLFPWHIPIWWQLARLRTAVEGDCDGRVLGRNPGQTKPYVNLLLEVGERSTQSRPLAVMLSEPYETLRRRIKIMTMPLSKGSWLKGLLLAGAGIVFVVFACRAPGPTEVQDEGPVASDQATALSDAAEVQESPSRPVFTPYTVRPSLRNLDEVKATLEREYPPLLEDAGIGGTANVWFFIDEEGKVQRVQIDQSSGHQALDEAALRVADVLKFTPALNRDRPVPVWVSLPIAFTTDAAFEAEPVPSIAERRREIAGRAPSQAAIPGSGETGQVTGTVLGGAGQPLADVQVYIPGTGLGQLTNIDGKFLMLDVPVGEYQIVGELIGYGQASEPVAVTAGEVTRVAFDLHLRAVALETLVVFGGG